jgi:hypothetical protein
LAYFLTTTASFFSLGVSVLFNIFGAVAAVFALHQSNTAVAWVPAVCVDLIDQMSQLQAGSRYCYRAGNTG